MAPGGQERPGLPPAEPEGPGPYHGVQELDAARQLGARLAELPEQRAPDGLPLAQAVVVPLCKRGQKGSGRPPGGLLAGLVSPRIPREGTQGQEAATTELSWPPAEGVPSERLQLLCCTVSPARFEEGISVSPLDPLPMEDRQKHNFLGP